MPDYAGMYRTLFYFITKAIAILQEAQQQTEEMYISDTGPVIIILFLGGDEAAKDGG